MGTLVVFIMIAYVYWVLTICHVLTFLILTTTLLDVWRTRGKEQLEWLAQAHTARKWQTWDLNLGLLATAPPPSFTVLQYFTCHGAFCAGDIPTSLEFLSWCLIYLYGFPLTPFPCSHKTPSDSENRVPLMNHQDIDGHFWGFLWRSHFLILTQFTRMKQWLWHIIPTCSEMNENLYPHLLVEKRDADHIFGTHHLYK